MARLHTAGEDGTVPQGRAEQAPWPVLGDVIGMLDAEALHVVQAPHDGGGPVNEVVILDRTDPHGLEPGAVVLGVGLAPDDTASVTLVESARRAGVAAIVLRSDGPLPVRLLEAAAESPLALLTAPPEMTWGQLYSLLRTAIVSAGGAYGQAGPTGTPIGDLFALADAVATSVRGPVTIEDPQWRLLAYSNLNFAIDDARRQTILGRTPPLDWQTRLDDAGVAHALRTGEGVVRFEGLSGDDLAPRLAAPVRAGRELLGTIWVAEADTPLGPEQEDELARAAELAAIHLIAHRASEDVKRRTRGAFIREVLDGHVPSGSARRSLPLRTDGPLTVIAFAQTARERNHQAPSPDRILSIISLYCEDLDRDAMCACIDDRFWALVPTPPSRARERTLELAAKIVSRIERGVEVTLAAGIGASVPRIAEVPRSRRGAEQALKVLGQRGLLSGVVHIEDVRSHAVLLDLLEIAADHPGLAQGKVDELIAYDATHTSNYAETLRIYLECWGDTAAAARRLNVHANTMRYRVHRIVELAGIDLLDPDERFVTELQLRIALHAPGREP